MGRKTGKNRVSGAAANAQAGRVERDLLQLGNRPGAGDTPVDALFGAAPVIPAMGGMSVEQIEQLKTRIADLAKRGDIKGIDALFNGLPKDVKQFLQPAYDKMREQAIDSAVKSTNDAAAQAKAMGATDEAFAKQAAAEAEARGAAGAAAMAGPLGEGVWTPEKVVASLTPRQELTAKLSSYLSTNGNKLPTTPQTFRAMLTELGADASAIASNKLPSGLSKIVGTEAKLLRSFNDINKSVLKDLPAEKLGQFAESMSATINPVVDAFTAKGAPPAKMLKSVLKTATMQVGEKFDAASGITQAMLKQHPYLSALGGIGISFLADQAIDKVAEFNRPDEMDLALKMTPTPEQAVADDLANEMHQQRLLRLTAQYYPDKAASLMDAIMGGGQAAAPQGPAVDPNSPALPTELSSYGR